MAEAKKYDIGTVFKSTRYENDAFVVSGKIITDKATETTKGKPKAPKKFAYEISHIPDLVVEQMSSGSAWRHERNPFMSNDEIIDKEISLGNWILLSD